MGAVRLLFFGFYNYFLQSDTKISLNFHNKQSFRLINTLKIQADEVPDCDGIIGGPPCQSFSASGRRAGGAAGRTGNPAGGSGLDTTALRKKNGTNHRTHDASGQANSQNSIAFAKPVPPLARCRPGLRRSSTEMPDLAARCQVWSSRKLPAGKQLAAGRVDSHSSWPGDNLQRQWA